MEALEALASVARLVSRVSPSGRVVLVLGQGLFGRPPLPQPLREPGSSIEAWEMLTAGVKHHYHLLSSPETGRVVEAVRGLNASRIIYTGVDGVLARTLGDIVVEVYGSVARGRCPRCGRRVWVPPPDEWRNGAPRCPRCGATLEPEARLWGPPRQRVVGEAVYEATTADLVVACCIGREVFANTLVLAASKFTGVHVVGESVASAVAGVEASGGRRREENSPG